MSRKKKKNPGGRPPLPVDERRVRVNVMLAPDVIDALADIVSERQRSAYIESLIRRDLARRRAKEGKAGVNRLADIHLGSADS